MEGNAKESAGLALVTENTPPVIAELLVFMNANSMPSAATLGFAAKAASTAALPVLLQA
jgi:hypothetical protein